MYGRYQILKKYLDYYFHAANARGHGIHSPFVFDFIKNVLNDRQAYGVYARIESRRKAMLQNHATITVEDLGAGSIINKSSARKVSAIAASSLKPRKYAQLLYRMVKYYRPKEVIELGTSLGITTCYLASASDAEVHTLEGAAAVAAIASENFAALELNTITRHTGNFSDTFPALLPSLKHPAFIFIDGNHRKVPTLRYFNELLQFVDESDIVVFDDIHWSKEMEEAWETIKRNEAVTLTIDLFFIGIVLFRKDFKVKQHFSVRF